MAAEKYCIALTKPCAARTDLNECLCELFIGEGNKPVLTNSIDDAVQIAQGLKNWHPELTFDIREYIGRSTYAWELMQYGKDKVGKEILRTL